MHLHRLATQSGFQHGIHKRFFRTIKSSVKIARQFDVRRALFPATVVAELAIDLQCNRSHFLSTLPLRTSCRDHREREIGPGIDRLIVLHLQSHTGALLIGVDNAPQRNSFQRNGEAHVTANQSGRNLVCLL